ncbi:hypothetical protein V6N12_020247 [Hibiscus sabdariffa]|uniref:Uncharacterized protein n=1 Tax=Hibiscus sabdariffa TaxID=183260 RepID=A0ABR2A085_9ROSI
MEMQNQAFLMKLGHQLITDTDRLWVRIFKAKYIWDGILPQSIRKARSSRLWQGLTEICEVIYASVCWNICDGTTMDFWFDTRVGYTISTSCWMLWKRRCSLIFNSIDSTPCDVLPLCSKLAVSYSTCVADRGEHLNVGDGRTIIGDER